MQTALLLISLLLGYWFQDTGSPWQDATRLPVRGQVTFYAPGAMETAYDFRLRHGQVPYCDRPACAGYVATLRPGDLGRKVWLALPGRPVEGPFLVVDYAAAQDFERLLARGLIAEVDHATAQRWAMDGPLDGVVMVAELPAVAQVAAAGPAVQLIPTRLAPPPGWRVWLPALRLSAN